MGVYTRKDSPYFWLCLERPDARPLYEATRIRADAPTVYQRRDNRQLAEIRYHARMTALARAAYDPPTKPSITVAAYVAWYEQHVTAHKRSTARERGALRRFEAAFGPRDLASLTREDVLEWRTARVATVSPVTAERELDVLKHLLAAAVPKYLAASPIARLTRLKGPPVRTRILSPAQETTLLAVLDARDQALVLLALDTLMRLSDVVSLRREDDHGDYLVVHHPKVQQYEVPVSARVRAALDALPVDGPFYFPHRRTTADPAQWRNSVKQMLRRACGRAAIPYGRGTGITFHALRHTGASRMIDRGVDLRTVQELGGWTDLRQLSRYTHPTDAAKRAAVEKVGRA